MVWIIIMNTIEDYFSTEFVAYDNPCVIVGNTDSIEFSIPDNCCVIINAYKKFNYIPHGFNIMCIDRDKTLTYYLELKNVQVCGYIISKGILS